MLKMSGGNNHGVSKQNDAKKRAFKNGIPGGTAGQGLPGKGPDLCV